LLAAIPIPRRRLYGLAFDMKEVSRRDLSQLGVLGDLLRPFPGPLSEIPFGQRLQPPRNPPEQMFRWRVRASS
jgi:hypothetical protein